MVTAPVTVYGELCEDEEKRNRVPEELLLTVEVQAKVTDCPLVTQIEYGRFAYVSALLLTVTTVPVAVDASPDWAKVTWYWTM